METPPGVTLAANDSGTSRPKVPLVTSGHEENASEIVHRGIHNAKPMHSVRADQNTFVVVAIAIQLRHRLADPSLFALVSGRLIQRATTLHFPVWGPRLRIGGVPDLYSSQQASCRGAQSFASEPYLMN